jgi:hypothetical protein
MHDIAAISERSKGLLKSRTPMSSLYVFTLHVYFIILVGNTPLFEFNSFIVNTCVYLAVVFSIW